MTEQLQDDVPAIDIVENKAPIDIEEATAPPLDDSDPRAAIYAKAKEKRKAEVEGVPIGSEAAPEEQVSEPQDQPDEVTVKINGKERKVPREKVEEAGGVQAYQKQAAAAEELRLAKDERRRLQDMEQQLVQKAQQLQAYEQQISQRAVQQPASPPPAQAGELKQMATQYHEAVLNGDIETASELLIKLQGAQKQATPDADAIARKAAQEARAAMQQERQQERQQAFERERLEAVAKFEEEFSDIAEDPELRDFADMKTTKILKEHPEWSPAKIIGEAARQVREALGKPVKSDSTTSKLDAKRSMTTVRGGSARATPKPAPKAPTRSQYVENLRKARGLE
jgi:hypothetical protein